MTALALLAGVLLAAPSAARERDPKTLSSYAFDASRPAVDRVEKIPDWLLKNWREADSNPGYEAYLPSKKERAEFAAALDGLPPRLKETLNERLIAFYFVKNLQGNGITDWVLDDSSRTYCTMILNPAAFNMSVSELLTARERSAFRGAADIAVEAGGDNGILYIVMHESTHAFDYVRRLTPATEGGHAKALGLPVPDGWDVWRSYGVPRPEDDFPARERLTFYGFGGPKLDAAEAPAACAQLARSPFASLYGSRSWAEDAAELFVARHLTRDLGRPYRVRCGGKVREPMADPRVSERAERILAPLYAAEP